MFGSNGQEKADYSRGVLERFTRRAPKDFFMPEKGPHGNGWIKNVVNPRRINFFRDPHTMTYFEGLYTIDENSNIAIGSYPLPIAANKIVINHYYIKSWEEYKAKEKRGDVVYVNINITREGFEFADHNDEFDDGILRYRAERAKNFRPPDKTHADERLFSALANNLSPTLVPTTPPHFYVGKMETFLTCRAVAAYLQTKLPDDVPLKFFEETAIKAILRTLASGGMTFADARLLIRELPNLLRLPYPVVKDLRNAALQIIPQLMNIMHLNGMWKDYIELDYLQDLLKE